MQQLVQDILVLVVRAFVVHVVLLCIIDPLSSPLPDIIVYNNCDHHPVLITMFILIKIV